MMDNDSSFYEKPMNSYSTIKRSKTPPRPIDVHPAFVPQVRNVINFKAFAGIKHKKIMLVACSSNKINGLADRFKFLIPYADQMLSWMILFNQSHPELGPDFEFDDKTFLSDPDLEEIENNVPSLVNWNSHDPDCLIKVIMEMLVYYRKHQVEKLKYHERLAVEYNALLKTTEVCEEDVEVILIPDTLESNEARFLIRIALDFSELPRRTDDNTDHNHDGIIMQITYSSGNWSRVVPFLYLSESLEQLLGSANTLHIPHFTTHKNLPKYVSEVKKLIADKLNTVIVSFKKRQEFIGTALTLHSGSLVEYDAVDFLFISLLVEYKSFYFFAHVKLSNKFPQEEPKYTLQSCYQLNMVNELYKQNVYNIPYSPRWEPIRMLNEAFNFVINNEIDKLKAAVSSSSSRRW